MLWARRMTIADWYFDFVSPFAYLQSEQLASLAPKLTVRYKPVLFAGLLGANGQKGPAEIPAKRAFTYRFCIWQAKQLGIVFRFPPEHPFNPLPLLRLAIACDSSPEAVHRIFRFVWRDGRLPDLPIEWAELIGNLGMPDADARIASPEVKDELRRNTDDAIARGVFGVPTLVVGSELFWGADATQMAVDYVAAGCHFDDPEFARVAQLPIGAERKDVTPKPAPGRKGRTRIVGTAT
jgi:2-hydroxychromene-2-carboxylate isomerase